MIAHGPLCSVPNQLYEYVLPKRYTISGVIHVKSDSVSDACRDSPSASRLRAWRPSPEPRSAALTEAPFGNSSATSASITTTFELCRSRSVYFPRTNTPNSERMYSDRRSGSLPVTSVLSTGGLAVERSEERRVGKECRSRWSPY